MEEAIVAPGCMSEPPSVESLIFILQKCREKKNLEDVQRVHAHISSHGLEAHKALGNYLISMYVECESLPSAKQIFSCLITRNEYSWTSLIQGYVECGESEHVLEVYSMMQEDCLHPSTYTYVALLKACGRLKWVERGQALHAEIAKEV